MSRMGKMAVAGLLCFGAMAMGSLEIYRDGVKYRYVPVDDYVGFVRGASAVCGEREVPLLTRQNCPETKRLCKEAKELEGVRQGLESVRGSLRMLEEWAKSARPADPDAGKWIAAAEKMGKQKAQWQMQERRTEAELGSRERHFRRQVSAEEPRFLSRLCKEELELTLPPGLIDLRLVNVAELKATSLVVNRYLALRNHSGVDISAKDARVYARSLHRTLRPIRFRPWVVRPLPKQAPVKRIAAAPRRMMADFMAAPAPELSSPRRLGYRNYSLGKIDLPSTGEEVRVRLESYEVPKKCGEVSYPWRENAVYLACTFQPKQAVESDRWILKKGPRIVSENAYGEYRDGKYLLFVDRDDAVKVRRSRLVEKERSSGIFGGKIRRKDGYVIDLENSSDQEKQIEIVERIPDSTTEKIEVRLLKVEGAVRESLEEDGRLKLKVHLAPREHKRIRVLFELSYPKEMKIRY